MPLFLRMELLVELFPNLALCDILTVLGSGKTHTMIGNETAPGGSLFSLSSLPVFY
jgi:hypothetical protein